MPTIADWARAFAGWLQAGDLAAVRTTFIDISDNLRFMDRATAVELCRDPPSPTGHEGVDVALRALVEYTFGRVDLPVPAWARDNTPAAEPFFLVPNPAFRRLVTESTPEAFRRRNVYVPAEYFESV